MAEKKINQFGRISLAMVGVGFGVGLAALFTWEWIDVIVLDTIDDPVIRSAVGEIITLSFLVVATMSAPVVAGMIGIFEGLRSSDTKQAVIVGLACLVGAAVMIVIAGIFISFAGPEGGDNGEGPGFLDLVALAGLGGICSFLSGLFSTKFGAK